MIFLPLLLFKKSMEDKYLTICTQRKFNSLINEKGYLKGNFIITGNNISSLGCLKRVYGNLGINSNHLIDLGQLNYVKNDFWILKAQKLTSLGNIKKIGGTITLRYSNIDNLGKLKTVGKTLCLRDTNIKILSNLREVPILLLPDRFKNKNIDFIKTTEIKYFRNKKKIV